MSVSNAKRVMRAQVVTVLLLVTASRSEATASFAPRELGIGVGAFALLPPNADPVSWGLPISLEAGYYLESGFDLYLRVPFLMLQQRTGFGPGASGPGTVLATGGQFGVRYLFMEETIRPYVMLHVAALYFFRDPAIGNQFYAGPGTGVGVDFFVADSISLGVRGTADLFITLNKPTLFSVGGGINVSTYF